MPLHRSTRLATILAGAATAQAAACALLGPEILSPDWTSLGLAGESVRVLEPTPWGLYAGTHASGVFLREEASDTWRPAGLDGAGVIHDLTFLPTVPPRLLASVGPPVGDTVDAIVFATEDGETWAPSDVGDAATVGNLRSPYLLAPDPTQPDRVYLGLSGSIMRSGDAGRTWERVFGDIAPANEIAGITVRDDGVIWAAASIRPAAVRFIGLLYSADQGDSWGELYYGGETRQIYAAPDGRVWLARIDGVMVYSDRDQSWNLHLSPTTVEHPVGEAVTVLPAADTLYAVTNLVDYGEVGVFRLRPHRSEWDVIRVPLEIRRALSAAIDNQGRLLVGTATTGVWRME